MKCPVFVYSPPFCQAMVAPLRRHSRRLKEVGTGHLLYASSGWLLDHVVYVWAIYELGFIKGGLLMGSLATAYCAAMLVVYQRMGIDWVGAGSLDQLAPPEGTAWWQRALRWAQHRGGWVAFTILSVFQDAFITTAFYRKGCLGALTSRDWKVFFCSTVVSNSYWTLRSGAVGALIVHTWRQVHI